MTHTARSAERANLFINEELLKHVERQMALRDLKMDHPATVLSDAQDSAFMLDVILRIAPVSLASPIRQAALREAELE